MGGSGNVVLQGGSGDASSVVIEASDTDPLTIVTNNLSILAGSGINSDAFFNAFNGAGDVDTSGVTGTCTNCVGISDPLNTTTSDAGIWAANFPTGPITFNWDDGAGNGLWSDPLNWSSDSLPGQLDDATIGAGFSVTLNSVATINSLALDGNLTLSLGGSLTLGSDTVQGSTAAVTIAAGTLAVNGILDVSQFATGVNNVGGTIQGSGTIIGNVTNDANLNPGNSPGTLTIEGNLVLLSGSNLNMEIAGLLNGQYDVLDVLGDVALGGTMNIIVDTSSGYSGQLNDTFVPIKWVSSSGGSLAVISATPGYSFDFKITASGFSLVTTSIPGIEGIGDLPSIETLVFTDTLKNFFEPFTNGTFDEEDDEEKGQTLVCS
jgi:hypothetical protein